jgi:hypothetical protein
MKNAFVRRAEFGIQRDLSMVASIKLLANDVPLQSLHTATLNHSDVALLGTIYRPP